MSHDEGDGAGGDEGAGQATTITDLFRQLSGGSDTLTKDQFLSCSQLGCPLEQLKEIFEKIDAKHSGVMRSANALPVFTPSSPLLWLFACSCACCVVAVVRRSSRSF